MQFKSLDQGRCDVRIVGASARGVLIRSGMAELYLSLAKIGRVPVTE